MNAKWAVPLLCLCLGASAAGVAARPPDAATILERAERIRSPKLDYAVDFTIHVEDPSTNWKERDAAYTLMASGKDRSFVIMREPAQFYPGTLLIADGLYWLLLPRSNRPFQLAPRHVLNGDISNGDLARGNLIAYYSPRFEGEGNVDGEDCWNLELTRTDNLAMYPRIRAWITQKHFRPWRFEYYGEAGTLLKVADFRDYRETPLGVRSMRIEVENWIRPGERSTLVFSNLRKVDTSGLPYSRDGLIAVRDAARLKMETDGTPILPEELPAFLERVERGEGASAREAAPSEERPRP